LDGKKFVTLASAPDNDGNNERAANRKPAQQAGNATANPGVPEWRNTERRGSNQGYGRRMETRQDENAAGTAVRNIMKEIKIGLMNEDYAEVTEGLQEGQEVIVYIQSSSSTTQRMNMNPFGGMGGGAARVQPGGDRSPER